MNLHWRRIGRPLALLALSVSMAACTTVYQPKGATGGYTDTRITANTYIVEFSGNGNTSKDQVWNYWIYRCADLTQQKGFTYFTVMPKDTAQAPADIGAQPRFAVAAGDAQPLEWTEAKGGGGGGGYVYVPGSVVTITTWTSRATVMMFNDLSEPGARFALRAKAVTEALAPFIASQGRSGAMTVAELAKRAVPLKPNPTDLQPPAVPWSGGNAGRVDMNDLRGLIAK
ncbi:hypothetical protein [Variovorax sp. RCC_210]|jgi:hypothetical protein|uniref:CC0125/CC1285 family lipoprotein n=1 Tax=Variovorax sp. RCC_210 TaxID=3239217 RepID=UPI0035246A7E